MNLIFVQQAFILHAHQCTRQNRWTNTAPLQPENTIQHTTTTAWQRTTAARTCACIVFTSFSTSLHSAENKLSRQPALAIGLSARENTTNSTHKKPCNRTCFTCTTLRITSIHVATAIRKLSNSLRPTARKMYMRLFSKHVYDIVV